MLVVVCEEMVCRVFQMMEVASMVLNDVGIWKGGQGLLFGYRP